MPTFSLVFKSAPNGQTSLPAVAAAPPGAGGCLGLEHCFRKASENLFPESIWAPKVVSQQVQQPNDQNQLWLTQGSPRPPTTNDQTAAGLCHGGLETLVPVRPNTIVREEVQEAQSPETQTSHLHSLELMGKMAVVLQVKGKEM